MEGKQSGASAPAAIRSKPLTERPLDVLYVAYFGIHLLASIAVDAQLVYPPYSQRLFPEPLRKVLQDYLASSNDPFLTAAAAGSRDHVWFRVLLASEALVQIPFFAVGIWGLIHGEFARPPDRMSRVQSVTGLMPRWFDCGWMRTLDGRGCR